MDFDGTRALNDLSLACARGSITGLVGPNGAGKSTLINLAAGLLSPTSGSIRLLGLDHSSTEGALAIKERTGFQLEDDALFGYLTGREFLQFLGRAYRVPAATAEGRVESLARFLQLENALDRITEVYSTGMRKKLALAAAMLHNPELLVLDEPFESLDPLIVKRLKEQLTRYAGVGGTVLLSSHLLDAVEEICDQVAIIKDGVVAGKGDRSSAIEQAERNLKPESLEELYSATIGSGSAAKLDWLGPNGEPGS